MLAVFVNCGAVILGSIIGLLFSKKFTDELSDMIQTACGIITLVIGLQMAFKYNSIIVLSLALITGGLLGSWWDIDGKILSLGKWLERRFAKTESTETAVSSTDKNEKDSAAPKQNFAYAFLNASVLFCVGAMSIVGSFKAGIDKDYTLIFTKSILDGFMAIVFSAAMGPGTLFSALTSLPVQQQHRSRHRGCQHRDVQDAQGEQRPA